MINLPKHITNPDPYIYLSDDCWVVDCETTNLDFGDPCNKDNRLLLVVAKHVGTGERIVSWGSEYEQKSLLDRLNEASFIIAHNTKFELGWLARCGLRLEQVVSFCTVIGEYVIDGNVPRRRDLDSVCRRYEIQGKVQTVAKMIEAGICPSKIIPEWLEEYCIQDVEAEYDIFIRQRAILHARGLLPVTYTRNLLTPVLADIESNGMQLDRERVEKVEAKYRREYDEAHRELVQITGSINLNSPKQLATFLYDELKFPEPKNHYGKPIKTKSGARTTSQKHLAKLVARTAKQKRFLELYKRLAKLDDALTKYLTKFKECCTNDDGHLEAKFNQTVTRTHRLSSSGGVKYALQFQNMDRNFKPLFRARKKGWKFCEADQAQLEYRTAVELAGDVLGTQRIENKFDVHRHTANILSDAGEPPCGKHKEKDVSCKDCRQEAKSRTFTPLFFGSSGTPAEQAYYQAFKDEHKEITAWHERLINEVLVNKKLVLPTGLIAYWPDTRMTSTGYVINSTKICNYEVQCVDGDTEFLTSSGWKRIEDYKESDNVLVYDKTGVSHFESPGQFYKSSASAALRIKKQGVDMLLSPRHRVILATEKSGYIKETLAEDLYERYVKTKRGISDSVITNFNSAAFGHAIPETHLRLLVAFQADGTSYKSQSTGARCRLTKRPHIFHFRKRRKIERLESLLKAAGLSYTSCVVADGSTVIRTKLPLASKRFADVLSYSMLSGAEARVICDECVHWDGHNGRNKMYYSTNKENIDFIQYCASIAGARGSISRDDNNVHTLLFSNETRPTLKHDPGKNSCMEWIPGKRPMFCFKTSTGMWVARRNGHIFVTGNCIATAEVVPIGVVYLWHLTKAYGGLKLIIVNTVHDSVIAEVPPDEVDIFASICKEAMVDRVVWYLKEVYGMDFKTPLEVEFKASDFWNDSSKWQEQYLH